MSTCTCENIRISVNKPELIFVNNDANNKLVSPRYICPNTRTSTSVISLQMNYANMLAF